MKLEVITLKSAFIWRIGLAELCHILSNIYFIMPVSSVIERNIPLGCEEVQ